MKIQKKLLIPFYLALRETDGQLSLKEARTRDQMLKPLLEVTQTFEQDRLKIYEKFGTKENNQFTFKDSKTIQDVNAEVDILNKEMVDLPDVPGIRTILENTSYKPKVGESELIDEVMTFLV